MRALLFYVETEHNTYFRSPRQDLREVNAKPIVFDFDKSPPPLPLGVWDGACQNVESEIRLLMVVQNMKVQ